MKTAGKQELLLEGLNCAHCAGKIEEDVGKLDGIASAALNFVTKQLTVEFTADADAVAVVGSVKGVVHKHEPSIVVKERQEHSHGHEHAHSHEHGGEASPLLTYSRVGAGAVLFVLALLLKPTGFTELALYGAAFLLIGIGVLISAARNIARGEIFDENFLMMIASVGAFAIGEYPEAVAVMLFYEVGEALQDRAVNKSRRSISALMDIKPEYANRIENGATVRVHPEEVQIGAHILVKAGERVPLDGVVVEGAASLDTSALTGESVPRDAVVGSDVLAGFINRNGLLTVRVTRSFGESAVSKILDLVQNASAKKAATERFITKFAKYYTPAVVAAAALLAIVPPLLGAGAFTEWLHRALIFLVISCPCALVISIPLGFFGGIGAASKRGILVKGASYLEALAKTDTVVFDKTGTLTKGVFSIQALQPAQGGAQAALLETAAYAEYYSNHPIAASIVRAYAASGAEPDQARLADYTEVPGKGVTVLLDGHRVAAGNAKLMEQEGVADFTAAEQGGSVVHIAVDGAYRGSLVIADTLKDDAKATMSKLRALGVRKLIMLTGDREQTAAVTAGQLGLDSYHANLLPDQKVAWLEDAAADMAARNKKGKLIFLGDGINDAPVLARADVGVAMGALGSDAAIEAADVVIMTDEPSKLAEAIRIARKTKRIVWQNVALAFAVKAAVLLLGTLGMATMWEAVFADVGVALLAVLNAMRVLHSK